MPPPKRENGCGVQHAEATDIGHRILPTEKTPLLNAKVKNLHPVDIGKDAVVWNELINRKSTVRDRTRCEKVGAFILTLTVEPLMFLALFSFFARSVCVTNLIIDKVCRNRLNYNEIICSNLGSNASIKNDVEKFANNFGLYSNLISFGPSAFLMIVVGPWSDRYGRKAPLLLSIVGLLLDDIGVILNTIYFDAPVEYFLLSSACSGVTGGFIGIITLLYSIASEVTTTKMRTIKYALIELAYGMGASLGMLAGGLLYKSIYSYVAAFGVSIIGHALCIPWVVFVIKETRGMNVKASFSTKVKDLFSFEKLSKGWKACMKVRENSGRCQLWLLLLAMCCVVITYLSFAQIAYLYAFHLYGWDPVVFSEVNTMFSVTTVVVSVICVPLFIRVFRFRDPTLGLVGTLSVMVKNVFIGLAENRMWAYYTGNFLGVFGGMASLAVRARISKLVDKDELGTVFAFLATCESLIPLLSTIVIAKMYNATLDIFPGLSYLLGAALLIFPAGTFLWLSRMKTANYQQLKSKQVQET